MVSPGVGLAGAGVQAAGGSALGGVDGGLLGPLAAHRLIGGGLDVVGGPLGAGVVPRIGVGVLLELADGAVGVLGGPHVGRRVGGAVGEFPGQPAVEGFALGLLARRRPEVRRRTRTFAG